jgi:hypothetical protein
MRQFVILAAIAFGPSGCSLNDVVDFLRKRDSSQDKCCRIEAPTDVCGHHFEKHTVCPLNAEGVDMDYCRASNCPAAQQPVPNRKPDGLVFADSECDADPAAYRDAEEKKCADRDLACSKNMLEWCKRQSNPKDDPDGPGLKAGECIDKYFIEQCKASRSDCLSKISPKLCGKSQMCGTDKKCHPI